MSFGRLASARLSACGARSVTGSPAVVGLLRTSALPRRARAARPRRPSQLPQLPSSVRVGTDVQDIDEVEQALRRFGDRYTDRLFTAHEIASSGGRGPAAAPGLAARFAAKEAVLKVLRVDDATPDLHSIEVVRDEGGACTVALRDQAAELARRAGLSQWDVSLSHSARIATATVVAIATAPIPSHAGIHIHSDDDAARPPSPHRLVTSRVRRGSR